MQKQDFIDKLYEIQTDVEGIARGTKHNVNDSILDLIKLLIEEREEQP